jgi:hypothetical protein
MNRKEATARIIQLQQAINGIIKIYYVSIRLLFPILNLTCSAGALRPGKEVSRAGIARFSHP